MSVLVEIGGDQVADDVLLEAQQMRPPVRGAGFWAIAGFPGGEVVVVSRLGAVAIFAARRRQATLDCVVTTARLPYPQEMFLG